MSFIKPHRARAAAVLVFLAGLLVACDAPPDITAAPAVLVSVLPQKHFIERIAGDRIAVTVLVKPGQSPATYAPTARQVAEVANADVWFLSGVPFENVWRQRIENTNRNLEVVPVPQNIVALPDDPHIWTAPGNALILAERMRDTLADSYPELSEQLSAGFSEFNAEIAALDESIRDRLSKAPVSAFMVYHPAWSHFAAAYGLQQIAIEHEGKEPGPRQLARIIEVGKQEGVRVMLVQKQFSDATARTVADSLGIPIRVADPLASDYSEGLNALVDVLTQAGTVQ